jgi:hypothetical protein
VNRITRILGEEKAKRLSPWGIIKSRTIKINDDEVPAYDIIGINCLDYMDLMKKYTYSGRDSWKLDNVAEDELGRKKLPFDGSFKDHYTTAWDHFVAYNIIDVGLVKGLDDKMQLVALALTVAYASKIVPDEEMMYTKDENGNPVYLDMIFNVLGVINRLVSMPLYEVAFNMQGDQVMNKIRHEKTLRGKEKWLFKFTSFFNDRGMHDQLKKYYAGLSTAEKHEFFESVETDGIYIHIPPMWEKEPLYDRLKRMYKELGLERKLDCYVHKFGREIKVMRKMVVGEQYVLKLKQSSKKGFSGRSIGYINMKGLPDKTNRMRTNLQIYSTTPIKNGIDDCNNMNIGVDAKDIAKMHLFYRNSLVGRRELSGPVAHKNDFSNSVVRVICKLISG